MNIIERWREQRRRELVQRVERAGVSYPTGPAPKIVSRPVSGPANPIPQVREEALVSVLVVTLDRADLARRTVGPNLAKAGHPYELLTVDNGSKDYSVVDYMASLQPAYHRLNSTNEGYAPAINQMLLRAGGDFLCVMDPDLELPDNWAATLADANRRIPRSGVSGFHCVLNIVPAQEINGVRAHVQENVHGLKFFNRDTLNEVGYFCEEFPPYGNEDVEYNRRNILAGRQNYYVGESRHLGDDCHQQTPYRKMKWDYLKQSSDVLTRRFTHFDAGGSWYVGPPEIR